MVNKTVFINATRQLATVSSVSMPFVVVIKYSSFMSMATVCLLWCCRLLFFLFVVVFVILMK